MQVTSSETAKDVLLRAIETFAIAVSYCICLQYNTFDQPIICA